MYSPVICLTTSSESVKTLRAVALASVAYCRASSRATYSATLLSWWPIHLAICTRWPQGFSITTPIPDGPGLPWEPPSMCAIRVDIQFFPAHQGFLTIPARDTMREFKFGVKKIMGATYASYFSDREKCGKSCANRGRNFHVILKPAKLAAQMSLM